MSSGSRFRGASKANLEEVARQLADPLGLTDDEANDREREYRAQGLDEKTINALLKRGDGKIRVLHANVETVRVYLKCSWDVQVGMGGVVFVGIKAQEIVAACQLANVPRSRRESVADGIRVMQAKAGPLLNKKAAK